MDEHYPERLIIFKAKEVKKEDAAGAKEQKELTGTNFSATTAMNPVPQTTTGMGPSYPDKSFVYSLINTPIETGNGYKTINNGPETE